MTSNRRISYTAWGSNLLVWWSKHGHPWQYFFQNSALASGGAINSRQLSRVLNIDGCTFASCQAGSSLGSVLYVYGGLERITSVFLRNSHISGSLSSTSVSIRSASCLGVINTSIGNSNQLGLSAVDVGGQCESMFMQEPVLFNRDTISSDPAHRDSIYESFGADISVSLQIDIRDSVFSNLSHLPLQISRHYMVLHWLWQAA